MVDEVEIKSFTVVSTIFNGLSIAACLGAAWYYLFISMQRILPLKILFNLIISNFIVACASLLSTYIHKNGSVCSVSLIFTMIGYWSASFWSTVIAIYSYKSLKSIVKQEAFREGFYYASTCIWIVVCFLVPLVPIFGISGISFTYNGEYCGLSFLPNEQYVFMLTEGAPFVITILAAAISYGLQLREVRKMPRPIRRLMNIRMSLLMWYLFIQVCSYLPPLLLEIMYAFGPYDSVFLNVIRIHGDQLAGFFVSLLYIIQMYRNHYFDSSWFESVSPKLTLPVISSLEDEEDMA